MPELQIIGAPQSNYVWVTRIACHEKGVPYTLVPVMPHTPEVDAVHPLGKIPALRHGDVTLAESRAICFYIDHAFDGPPLVSRDPAEGARTEQWISIVNTHFDVLVARPYVGAYFFPGTRTASRTGRSSRPRCRSSTRNSRCSTAPSPGPVISSATAFTLADMNVLPMLFYLATFARERRDAGAQCRASRAYYERHMARAQRQGRHSAAVPGPLVLDRRRLSGRSGHALHVPGL